MHAAEFWNERVEMMLITSISFGTARASDTHIKPLAKEA
jgi:hypothetical protein